MKTINMKTVFNITYHLIVICLLLINNACNKNDCCSTDKPPFKIYKLKGDYINNVCVGLSDDKLSIKVFPSPTDNCGNIAKSPFEMKAGYYLDDCCNYGINSAYLSVTKLEYQNLYPIPKDSIMEFILDMDPYAEYYLDENNVLGTKETNGNIDTTFLNEIIVKQELGKYFTKLK